jgi:transposase-like protein
MGGLCPGKDVGMSVSGTMTKRRRRSFSPEFRAEIASLCRLPCSTLASVCKENELADTPVRLWVRWEIIVRNGEATPFQPTENWPCVAG